MEFNQIDGMFLTKFFSIIAVIGEDYKDKKQVFYSLAKVYCLTEDKIEALFRVVETEEISTIRCLEEYIATMRALDYRERFFTALQIPDEIRFALNCKGKALKAMYPLMSDCGKNPTKAQFKVSLAKQEIRNLIPVSFVIAFMHFEGIFLARDKEKAIKFAERCAEWNSIDGLFLLLYYGEANKKDVYKESLKTLIEYSQSEEDFSDIINKYGLSACKGNRKANLLIAKYMERTPNVCEVYDESVSKIAESNLISESDKTRIFDSGDRAAFSMLGDFAFNTAHCEMQNGKHLRELLDENRRKEANQVEICFKKQRTGEVKIPILVCQDNIVPLQYYSAIKSMVGENLPIKSLDAKNCSQADLSWTKGNCIIKTLLSGKIDGGVFVITDIDKISDEKAELLSGLLNPENRKKYPLQDINLAMDLSNCIFLLIAESENIHENIKNFCQIIRTEKASKKEMRAHIQSLIEKNKSAYECPGLSFGEDALAYLETKDTDHMAFYVEDQCHKHSFETETKVISKEEIIMSGITGGISQMAFQIKKQEK